MIENSLDIVTVVDGSGLIRYESPSVQTVLGYAPHEMTGNNAFSYMHPDDAERVFDMFMEAVREPGSTASAEYRFRHKNGSWCVLESCARNLLHDPAVEGVVVNSRDVTARHHAEEALRGSEEKLRAITESAVDAIIVTDHRGLICDWNRGAREIFGYEKEEALGQPLEILMPDQYKEAHRAGMDRYLGTQVPHVIGGTVEVHGLRKSGERFPLELSLSTWTAGGERFFTGIIRDSSERKQAEEALRRSEAHYRALLNAIPDAMVRVARDGTYLGLKSPSDFGWFMEPDHLVGRSAYEVLPPELVDTMMNATHATLESGETQTLEYTVEAGGEIRYREARVVACGEDEVMSIMRDITDRKRSEEALRRSEAHNRAIIDALPDAVVRLSRQGVYLDVRTPADYEAFTAPEKLIGTSAFDVLPEHIVPLARQCIAEALETGTLQSFEYEIPVGDKMHVREARVVPCGEDEVISIQRDVTERRRAEEALQHSEALLRTVVTNIPVVLFALDSEGTVTLAEGKGLEAIATSAGVGNADTAFELYHRHIEQDIDRALKGETFTSRTEFSDYTFESWFSPLLEEDGSVDGVIGVAADITEIERSRRQLRDLALHLQSVREEERTRISREVHDVLGQSLTALRMEVAWIEKGLHDEQASLQAHIAAMKEIIDETIGNVRRIASELRPGILDDLGLTAALEWQTQEFARRTGMQYSFSGHTDDLNLGRQRSTMVFRIFQEILTNVARHAEASSIDITLSKKEDMLELVVQDNGRGIRDEELANTTSLGLLGMHERAQAWGGTVHLSGIPGEGTRVRLQLPI